MLGWETAEPGRAAKAQVRSCLVPERPGVRPFPFSNMSFPQALREKYREKVDASSEHLTPTMPDFKIPVLNDDLLLQVGVA